MIYSFIENIVDENETYLTATDKIMFHIQGLSVCLGVKNLRKLTSCYLQMSFFHIFYPITVYRKLSSTKHLNLAFYARNINKK